jgi:hypothetical protein
MATAAAVKPAVSRRAPAAVKEKAKPVAYVNWAVKNANGEALLHSSKGFPLFENDYLTRAEKDLIAAAKANDGSVVLNAELRVSIARDANDRPDISGAIVAKK